MLLRSAIRIQHILLLGVLISAVSVESNELLDWKYQNFAKTFVSKYELIDALGGPNFYQWTTRSHRPKFPYKWNSKQKVYIAIKLDSGIYVNFRLKIGPQPEFYNPAYFQPDHFLIFRDQYDTRIQHSLSLHQLYGPTYKHYRHVGFLGVFYSGSPQEIDLPQLLNPGIYKLVIKVIYSPPHKELQTHVTFAFFKIERSNFGLAISFVKPMGHGQYFFNNHEIDLSDFVLPEDAIEFAKEQDGMKEEEQDEKLNKEQQVRMKEKASIVSRCFKGAGKCVNSPIPKKNLETECKTILQSVGDDLASPDQIYCHRYELLKTFWEINFFYNENGSKLESGCFIDAIDGIRMTLFSNVNEVDLLMYYCIYKLPVEISEPIISHLPILLKLPSKDVDVLKLLSNSGLDESLTVPVVACPGLTVAGKEIEKGPNNPYFKDAWDYNGKIGEKNAPTPSENDKMDGSTSTST